MACTIVVSGPDNTYQPAQSSVERCTAQTVCPAGTFVGPDSVASTRNCTACPSGSYQPADSHRLPSCTVWRTCAKGQFVSHNATPTSDRKCARHGDCTSEEYESRAPTLTSARACEVLSVCGKGFRVVRNATASTDLACGLCDQGMYQNAPNRMPTCLLQRRCGPREFISPDTSTERRSCLPCPVGTYQGKSSHQEAFCIRKTTDCPSGAYFVAGTDNELSTDDALCLACPENTFKVGVSNATECVPQPFCGPGEHTRADSTTVEHACEACVVGHFQAGPLHRSPACISWSTCEREGQFEAAAPNATHDRVCGSTGPCFVDEFESQPGTTTSARLCTRLSTCGRGQRVSIAPTNTSDLSCGSCNGESYQAAENHRNTACLLQPTLQCSTSERPSMVTTVAARTCVPCSETQPCLTTSTTVPPTPLGVKPGAVVVATAPTGDIATPAAAGRAKFQSNTTTPAQDQTGEGSDDDDSGMIWIVAIAVAVLFCAAVVFAVILPKCHRSGSETIQSVIDMTFFTNPTYDASPLDVPQVIKRNRGSVQVRVATANTASLYNIPFAETSFAESGSRGGHMNPAYADGSVSGQRPGSIQVASDSVEYDVPMGPDDPSYHGYGTVGGLDYAVPSDVAGDGEYLHIAGDVGDGEEYLDVAGVYDDAELHIPSLQPGQDPCYSGYATTGSEQKGSVRAASAESDIDTGEAAYLANNGNTDEGGEILVRAALEHAYDAASSSDAMPTVCDDPKYYAAAQTAKTALYSEASASYAAPAFSDDPTCYAAALTSPYDEDEDLAAPRWLAKKSTVPHSNMGIVTAEGMAF